MLGDSSEVDVEVVVTKDYTTITSRLSLFRGGQLIWKLGVVVGFFLRLLTTTASKLSQGLGRCFSA